MVEHYYVANHNVDVLLQKSNLTLFIQPKETCSPANHPMCGGDKLGIILN